MIEWRCVRSSKEDWGPFKVGVVEEGFDRFLQPCREDTATEMGIGFMAGFVGFRREQRWRMKLGTA